MCVWRVQTNTAASHEKGVRSMQFMHLSLKPYPYKTFIWCSSLPGCILYAYWWMATYCICVCTYHCAIKNLLLFRYRTYSPKKMCTSHVQLRLVHKCKKNNLFLGGVQISWAFIAILAFLCPLSDFLFKTGWVMNTITYYAHWCTDNLHKRDVQGYCIVNILEYHTFCTGPKIRG